MAIAMYKQVDISMQPIQKKYTEEEVHSILHDLRPVQIWKWGDMSKQGFKHWNAHLRTKVSRKVIRKNKTVYLSPIDINNPTKIGDMVLEVMHEEGDFWLMGGSKSFRNSYRHKFKKWAEISVKQGRDGLYAKVALKGKKRIKTGKKIDTSSPITRKVWWDG